jgi:hypothetical protein
VAASVAPLIPSGQPSTTSATRMMLASRIVPRRRSTSFHVDA